MRLFHDEFVLESPLTPEQIVEALRPITRPYGRLLKYWDFRGGAIEELLDEDGSLTLLDGSLSTSSARTSCRSRGSTRWRPTRSSASRPT